jgi:predicted CopG family antitoxin
VNKNNISNKIHTIAIDDNNYQTLRSLGSFGDSFNNIVTNLLLKTARRKKVEDRQDDNH